MAISTRLFVGMFTPAIRATNYLLLHGAGGPSPHLKAFTRPTKQNNPASALAPPERSNGMASLDTAIPPVKRTGHLRSEEHTSELQSLMRISYAVFCLKKKNTHTK